MGKITHASIVIKTYPSEAVVAGIVYAECARLTRTIDRYQAWLQDQKVNRHFLFIPKNLYELNFTAFLWRIKLG